MECGNGNVLLERIFSKPDMNFLSHRGLEKMYGKCILKCEVEGRWGTCIVPRLQKQVQEELHGYYESPRRETEIRLPYFSLYKTHLSIRRTDFLGEENRKI